MKCQMSGVFGAINMKNKMIVKKCAILAGELECCIRQLDGFVQEKEEVIQAMQEVFTKIERIDEQI